MDASNTNIASLHQFCSNSCSKAFSKTLCHTDSSPYGEHPKSFPKLESPFLLRSANQVLSRHVPSLLDFFTAKPLFGTFFVASWPFYPINPIWIEVLDIHKLVPNVHEAQVAQALGPDLVEAEAQKENSDFPQVFGFRWFSVAPQVLPSFEAFLQDTQLEVGPCGSLGPAISGLKSAGPGGSPIAAIAKLQQLGRSAWQRLKLQEIPVGLIGACSCSPRGIL